MQQFLTLQRLWLLRPWSLSCWRRDARQGFRACRRHCTCQPWNATGATLWAFLHAEALASPLPDPKAARDTATAHQLPPDIRHVRLVTSTAFCVLASRGQLITSSVLEPQLCLSATSEFRYQDRFWCWVVYSYGSPKVGFRV